MRSHLLAAATAVALFATPALAAGGDATDAQIARITDEGFSHSQAMANASELMDGIGPRLTNSGNFDRAADWALGKFRAYGLANVHKEAYPFGSNWNLDGWSARMVQPRAVAMHAMPVAWSPATSGVVTAPSVRSIARSATPVSPGCAPGCSPITRRVQPRPKVTKVGRLCRKPRSWHCRSRPFRKRACSAIARAPINSGAWMKLRPLPMNSSMACPHSNPAKAWLVRPALRAAAGATARSENPAYP